MTDYAPIIPPAIEWSNSYSTTFCTLLSICAVAKIVVARGASVETWPDGTSAVRAKRLLTRELVARFGTGSCPPTADYDPLVDQSSFQYGSSTADDFATRGTATPYPFIGVARVRFSVPKERHGVLDPPEFVLVDALGAYQNELNSVLAESYLLFADVNKQAADNALVDSAAAAAAAASLASARAAYVAQLQAAYPGRGYA